MNATIGFDTRDTLTQTISACRSNADNTMGENERIKVDKNSQQHNDHEDRSDQNSLLSSSESYQNSGDLFVDGT